MLVRFLLPFIQTLIIFKKITSVEHFDVIDVALRNLEGIVDVERNKKIKRSQNSFDELKNESLLSIKSQFSKPTQDLAVRGLAMLHKSMSNLLQLRLIRRN